MTSLSLSPSVPRIGPATLYALAALLFGALYLAVLPPLGTPDAGAHFLRSVHLSQGHWLPREIAPKRYGGELPAEAVAFVRTVLVPRADRASPEAVRAALGQAGTGPVTADFSGAAAYPPLSYLPQAAGLALGRMVGLDLLSSYYLARAFNLLCFVALTAFAIRLLPAFHATVAFTALVPFSFSQAATISADALNFAIPLLLICAVLRQRRDPAPLTVGRGIGLLLLTLSLGLLKPTSPVFGLSLILAGNRIASPLWRLAAVLLPTGAALALAIGWSSMIPFVSGEYYGKGAVPLEQVRFVLDDPLNLLRMAAATLFDRGWIYWHSAFGLFPPLPGEGLHWAPTPLALAALAGLMILPLLEARGPSDGWAAAVLAGVGAILIAGTVLAFWLTFTAPGELIVRGVQGRYLTAAYGCLFLALGHAVRGRDAPRAAQLCAGALLVVYVLTALYAVSTYSGVS